MAHPSRFSDAAGKKIVRAQKSQAVLTILRRMILIQETAGNQTEKMRDFTGSFRRGYKTCKIRIFPIK